MSFDKPLKRAVPHIQAAMVAGGLLIAATSPLLNSPATAGVFLLFGLAWILSLRQHYPPLPDWVLLSLWTIVISGIIGIGVSWWQGGEFPASVTLALLTLGMIPLAFARLNHLVFVWLTPGLYWHLWKLLETGFNYPSSGRMSGITINPNIGAGLLVLGIAGLMPLKGWRWLAVPLAAGLPLGGSRLATMVAVGLVCLYLTRNIKCWKTIAWAGGMLAIALVITAATNSHQLFHRSSAQNISWLDEFSQQALTDVQGRTDFDNNRRWSLLIPTGYHTSDQHNVPLRIAEEYGLGAAAAWVAGTAFVLKRRRDTSAWWVMLAATGLAMLDYYTWAWPLGGFWWVAVGMLTTPYDKDASRPVAKAVCPPPNRP